MMIQKALAKLGVKHPELLEIMDALDAGSK